MLILQAEQLQTMKLHAVGTYPEECCGLLLGTQASNHDRRQVFEVIALPNHWTARVSQITETEPTSTALNKGNRYWVDPKDLLNAQRTARDRGWIILGVYHSHPDHPAEPSERDRRLAWTEYSYPILSTCQKQVVDIQSWRLSEQGHFESEKIILADVDHSDES
ncbi:MAG: M67 family metallopeptidase [Cyanobacteria bacterium P01_H01_bin.58]